MCIFAMAKAKGMDESVWIIVAAAVMLVIDFAMLCGLFIAGPNQLMVVTLFGKYKGTVRKAGLHWGNPFLWKAKVSLRVRNFETTHLKANDYDRNPIEIAAAVVWKVSDNVEALFELDH